MILSAFLFYGLMFSHDGSTVDRLFEAISKTENCRKWNNPGCLKYAKQEGAKRGHRGYAVFKTVELGSAALMRRIEKYRGQKVGTFLKKYNPGVRGYVSKVLHNSDGLTVSDVI